MKINIETIEAFKKVFNEESSDRAKVIIAVSQIDYLIKLKLKECPYSHGNKEAREKLFSENGAFATFSSKVKAAYCAGWIDSDVYNDIEILRKIRNLFAHSFESLSLDSAEIKKIIGKFQVPHREFYDWNELKISVTKNGIVFYTGYKPNDAEDNLEVPGKIIFIIAVSIIYAVLLDNLDLKSN